MYLIYEYLYICKENSMTNFFLHYIAVFFMMLYPYLMTQLANRFYSRRAAFVVSVATTINWEILGAVARLFSTFAFSGLLVNNGIAPDQLQVFQETLQRHGFTVFTFALQLLALNLSVPDYQQLYRFTRESLGYENANRNSQSDILLRLNQQRDQFRLNMSGTIPSFTPSLSQLLYQQRPISVARPRRRSERRGSGLSEIQRIRLLDSDDSDSD